MTLLSINTYDITNPDQHGFTVVEMIVTIVVLSIFMTGIFQSYLLLESQRVLVARQARASDIAYSNLRKFQTRPANLLCNPAQISPTRGLVIGNESNYPGSSAYGFVAESGETVKYMGRTSQLHQTVTAYAPNGCTGSNFTDGIVKIISTVTYEGGSVSHAGYVK